MADRYDRLVVASGDHIFADLVTDAVGAGVSTAVVALPRRVSWTLWVSDAEVIEVEPAAPPKRAPVRPRRAMPRQRTGEIGCANATEQRVLR